MGNRDRWGDPKLEPWHLHEWIARMEAAELDPYEGEQPPEYEYADMFYAPEFGFFWPHCPRFYLEFASEPARREASRIISMLRAESSPILASQYTGLEMSTREVHLFKLVRRFDAKQFAEERRAESRGVVHHDFVPDPNSELSDDEQIERYMRGVRRGR